MSDRNRGSRELRSHGDRRSSLGSRTVSLHQTELRSKGHRSKFDRDRAKRSAYDVTLMTWQDEQCKILSLQAYIGMQHTSLEAENYAQHNCNIFVMSNSQVCILISRFFIINELYLTNCCASSTCHGRITDVNITSPSACRPSRYNQGGGAWLDGCVHEKDTRHGGYTAYFYMTVLPTLKPV